MSDEHASTGPEMNEFEAALGSLVPSRGRIDRDRVMFRAGQASVRPPSASGRRGWMAVAASLALVASGEGVLLARRPPAEVVERIVVVREPSPPPSDPDRGRVASGRSVVAEHPGPFAGLGSTAHERLAGQVLRYGLDGLPRSASDSWGDPESRPVTSRQQLQEELRKTLDPGDPT